jgi:outer membrane protein
VSKKLALVCSLVVIPVAFGQAQKIGVIQTQSAMVSTKDGQKAVQELDTRLQPRKAGLERKAAEVRELQDRLQRGGAAMAEAARQDLTRQIDAKTKSYNRDMQDAQDEYEQENRKLLQELSTRMTSVIDKYAVDHGYSVILDVSNPATPVMYVSNTVDVTRDIIDLYDKMITVPASAPAKPAAPKPAAMPVATPKKQP